MTELTRQNDPSMSSAAASSNICSGPIIPRLNLTGMTTTPLGEYILAVGGNQEAARIAGVPVARTKVSAFVIPGGLASVAAIIIAGWLALLNRPLAIYGSLMQSRRRRLADGRQGKYLGTLLGAVILRALRNGLTLMNVQAFYQLLATGIIIIAAVLIDRATQGSWNP